MTASQDDLTIIRPLVAMTLVVRDPSGRVRRVPLVPGVLTIGRDPASGLPLETDDASASRHHASLTVDGATVTVTDCGSTNGVFINAARVSQAVLAPGDELRLGHTVCVLASDAPGAPEAPMPPPVVRPASGRPGRRSVRTRTRLLLLLGVLAALLVWLGMLFSSPSQRPSPDGPAPREEAASPAEPAPADTPAPAPEAVEKANDLSRQALFFYNNKQLRNAIDAWEKALALDPRNAQAAKWLARAESERDQLLDKYYREAVTALKYARVDEAKTAFRFVTEYCRSQSADERCLDAAKHLRQLEGNTP